ncbi:MAG: DEAD/DEAH box helicase family protein [Halanaerobiales bacterium]
MKVKKYVAETMQDAIFKVKADLGPDAIILNTSKYKTGGFLGFFSKTMVEVLAGVEEKKAEPVTGNSLALQEIADLKNLVYEMHQNWENDRFLKGLPEELLGIYKYLNEQGVFDHLNKEIIRLLEKKELEKREALLSQLSLILKEYIGEGQAINLNGRDKVVAFVGATGVGKTTTVAKLAAHFVLDEGKKVCLITTDTYRIAAVQQLQTYSDIINIPIHVAYSDIELERLLSVDLKGKYDLILIDTAGSSWNDQFQIGRLKKIFKKELVDEVHLILSLNTKSQIQKEIIDKFSILSPDKLLLTKLDETSKYGDFLNIRNFCKLPYSYITMGQNVPDDIRVADLDLIIDYLLGDLDV